MTDANQTTADPYADLLKDVGVCQCGSCRTALDEALAELGKVLNDPEVCTTWYMAHAYAHAAIAAIIVMKRMAVGDTDMYIRAQSLASTYSEPQALDYIDRTISDMAVAAEAGKN